MGLFGAKATCINCEKEVGMSKHKTSDGWLCPDCFKLCCYTIATPIKTKTLADIKNDISKINAEREEFSKFNATKKVSAFIHFDEEKKLWLIPNNSLFGANRPPRIYKFEDIVEYELLEDGETLTKGGLGRAVAGGVLFGGVGAIVGGVTGGKKSKTIVSSLKIKITINDLQNPIVYIDFINTKTQSDSIIYKNSIKIAQQILSVLAVIERQNETTQPEAVIEKVQSSPVSVADEILKFKSLLDSGIISQEEFDAKKKQLLNI